MLGPKKLYVVQSGGKSTTRTLSQAIKPWGQFVTALVGEDAMYVGANRGEWGGGLLHIKVSTGDVAQVERRDDRGLCSGPLNGDCDPVTGLVADAEWPGCVFASIGLAHMSWQGRVLHICGNRIETVFEAEIMPIGVRIQRALSSRARQFPPQTEPIFSLAPAAGGFWAVTPRALYRWKRRVVDRQPFPKLKQIHGLAASTSIPGLVVATTDANAALSLSGTTPLVFARGDTEAAPR